MFRSAIPSFSPSLIMSSSTIARVMCVFCLALWLLRLPHPSPDYQEEKKGLLQWKVCVKALPSVTTRPWPPERLRSTTTRGICTSWMGLFPSFSAWVRFNTWRQTGLMTFKIKKRARTQALWKEMWDEAWFSTGARVANESVCEVKHLLKLKQLSI